VDYLLFVHLPFPRTWKAKWSPVQHTEAGDLHIPSMVADFPPIIAVFPAIVVLFPVIAIAAMVEKGPETEMGTADMVVDGEWAQV
jgi:hypothetical protein